MYFARGEDIYQPFLDWMREIGICYSFFLFKKKCIFVYLGNVRFCGVFETKTDWYRDIYRDIGNLNNLWILIASILDSLYRMKLKS